MGCDIHLIAESRSKKGDGWGEWQTHRVIALDHQPNDDGKIIAIAQPIWLNRSYELFGRLAGVRKPELQMFECRGLPNDMHEWTQNYFDNASYNLHHWSWLTYDEIWEVARRSINPTLYYWLEYMHEPYGVDVVQERFLFAFDN